MLLAYKTASDHLEHNIRQIDHGIEDSEREIAAALKTIERESRDISAAKTLRAEFAALLAK